MHTKNSYENGPNPFFSGFFNLMGTRMVQIRMAKSVCSPVTKSSNGFGHTNLDHSRTHKNEKTRKKRIWSIFV